MSKQSHLGQDWETVVHNTALKLDYPPTPNIAARADEFLNTRHRRLTLRYAWTLLIVLIVLGALLIVPDVRASVLKFLRIGSVQINLDESPDPLPPLSIPGKPDLELAGETTLASAQATVDFPIKLPAEMGQPDHVYLQQGPVVILVWVSEDDPSRAELSLYMLAPGVEWMKGEARLIEETTVNGRWAIWMVGSHLLQFKQNDRDLAYLVEGQVLLWEDGYLTYRLETGLSKDEARKIAESLR